MIHFTITHYKQGTCTLCLPVFVVSFLTAWRGLTDFKAEHSHGRMRLRVVTKDTWGTLYAHTHTHAYTGYTRRHTFSRVTCADLFHLLCFMMHGDNTSYAHTHTHAHAHASTCALCVISEGFRRSKPDTLRGVLDLVYTSSKRLH